MSFIIGADISSLEAMEDYGAKYYDLNGEEGDVIKILASHGVNCIRLRLFNKPTESFDKGDYCDLKHTLRMAKRIKKNMDWDLCWIFIIVIFGQTGNNRKFQMIGKILKHLRLKKWFMNIQNMA